MRWDRSLTEAHRWGCSCGRQKGVEPPAAWLLGLHGHPSSSAGPAPSSCIPAPLLLPSLLLPEEVQLEGDRARSSAGADRTKVNMPAIAAASSLWTDDGRWAGEDHTHEAPWTTQAPACLPACATRLHAEAYMGCFHSHHPWGPTAPQMLGDTLLKYPVISKLLRGTEGEHQGVGPGGTRVGILSPLGASVSLFGLGNSTG